MKNYKIYMLCCIIITTIIFISCNKDCTSEDTFVENKLTPQVLSFFSYDSFDTLKCIIGNKQNIILKSKEKEDKINTSKVFDNYDCGTGISYNNHQRTVDFFDDSNKLVLRTQLKLRNNNYLDIFFDFYNSDIKRNYSIGMFPFEIPDTATIDRHFYSDIFYIYEPTLKYHLYYSKSSGLIRIMANEITIFQLIK